MGRYSVRIVQFVCRMTHLDDLEAAPQGFELAYGPQNVVFADWVGVRPPSPLHGA